MVETTLQIVIRVDSSERIASGHLIRCLTLADELRSRGASVLFLSREHRGHFLDRVESMGYSVVRLPPPAVPVDVAEEDYGKWLGVSLEQDIDECMHALRGRRVDWLVVDHYSLDHAWERRMRAVAPGIVAIDDLANRHHDCDVLLDQNYFGSKTSRRYVDLVSPACTTLLGPKYALLQPEYGRLRRLLPGRDGFARRVLVFFGGSDRPNDTLRVLHALESPGLDALAVDVVAGQNHPNRAALAQWVESRRGAALYSGLPSLAALMVRADLSIGGGGSTTWERACLSLPSVIVTLADNQKEFSEALAQEGYQVLLGRNTEVSVEMWREGLTRLVENPNELEAMSRLSATLTDGTGAALVAEAILNTALTANVTTRTLAASPKFGDTATTKPRVSLLSDPDSWLNEHMTAHVARWRAQGYSVQWVHDGKSIASGDVCFIVGCSQLLKPDVLSRNKYNLVVHESALPEGRGWSPMTWQILEDRRKIVVSLFEAAATVDSGRIHLQTSVELDGTELIAEWRRLQAKATGELCQRWLDEYPEVVRQAREQVGTPTYFRKRGPADSRIDPNLSIASQFDLLRVVDNDRYPAFFEYRGGAYRLLVERGEVE